MRWRQIRVYILLLLVLLNMVLLGIRTGISLFEKREAEEGLKTVCELYEKRGIRVKAVPDADRIKIVSHLLLGETAEEPRTSFVRPSQPVLSEEGARILAETEAESCYGRAFGLYSAEEAEEGWRFVFCALHDGLLACFDRLEVFVTEQGIREAVRLTRPVISEEADDFSVQPDQLMSRALWQLSSLGFPAVELSEVQFIYSEDGDIAVPAVRFVFTDAAGASCGIVLK